MKVQNKVSLLSAVTLSMGAALTACGGLGDGIGPVNAVLQPLGGLEGAASTKAYTCLNTGLTFIVDFSDGSRGDFTGRANYSSSNPAVARVSNFDIPVPEQTNVFYNPGTIVAVAPGTATVTANYLTFTRSIEVVVGTPQNLKVTPASADLAAKSLLDLAISAELDGVATPIDAAVIWAFVTPNTATATIDAASGTITGVAAGAPLTARARIPGCDLTAEAPVTVANLQSLALSREFGDVDTLILNTTERLAATGTLDNGKTQDLSTQVSYSSSDASAISLLTSGIPNLLLALKASTPVQFTASFASSPVITSPAISITPVADALNTIALTPASVDLAAGTTKQLKATGSFASGNTQDITRHVLFTTSDTTTANVQSSTATVVNNIAGLLTAVSTAKGKTATVTATATNAAGQAATAAATVNVQ